MRQSTPADGPCPSDVYNIGMAPTIPPQIIGQKYVSLATFRKNGTAVHTPVWFGEENGHLYVMTRGDMGKSKRLRNSPNVKIAPCTIRGKITGPEFSATARFLRPEEFSHIRQLINKRYFLARLPLIWSRIDTYIEITPV